ncbi:MAG: ATP-binding protein [Candidatus Magasanikbacteria bacterium]|nr:ATP-binding protein [Candidatus Magasanikbacteria bacterium]
MIKRALFEDLKQHLTQKEMSLIVGPRQAGKTTLMRSLQTYLQEKGEPTLFLNLDIEHDRQFFASQDALVKKISLEFGTRFGYVFLDEIQRKENAGLFLKGLYDMNLSCKFIVSGSGSVELKEKIHESLSGRKRLFEMTTVTFLEFTHFKTQYRYEGHSKDFFEIDKMAGRQLLDEYLAFGGYPRVILSETFVEKQKIIDEIYQSYVEKDIATLLGVKKTDDFTRLVKLLAHQIGNFVSISELSATLGISSKTVQQYLWYLEKTCIVQKVTPYFTNPRKEITKSPLFYFKDLGLRNFSAGEFGSPREGSLGFLFENLVHTILNEQLRFTGAKIHFWRSKDGAEVDFIVANGDRIIPIEVKYKSLKKPEITRSLRSFIGKYRPADVWLVNLELNDDIQISSHTALHTITSDRMFGAPFFAVEI